MGWTYTKALFNSVAPSTPSQQKKKRSGRPQKNNNSSKEPKKQMVNGESLKPKPPPKPSTAPQQPSSTIVTGGKSDERTAIVHHSQAQVASQSQCQPPQSFTYPISSRVANNKVGQISNNDANLNMHSFLATQANLQKQCNNIVKLKLATETNSVTTESTVASTKKTKFISDDEENSKIANNTTSTKNIAVPINNIESTMGKEANAIGSQNKMKIAQAAAHKKTLGSTKQPSAKFKEVPKVPKKTSTPSSAPPPTPPTPPPPTTITKLKGSKGPIIIPTLSAPTRASRPTTNQPISEPEKQTAPTTVVASSSTVPPPPAAKARRGPTRAQNKKPAETDKSQGVRIRRAASSSRNGSGRKRTTDMTDEDDEQSKQSTRPTKRVIRSKRAKRVLPILDESYKLSIVFHGHTNVNIPAKDINDDELDDAKDLWCCEFEPSLPQQTEISNIVAFCGSYSVLFMDTHLGRYTKKYTHSEIQEIFYCMAWTTLSGKEELLNTDINEEDANCNILAVAGRLGSIKLLNPLQNECYRYLFGHDKPVLKLSFSKTEPRWLLSASADKTVRLWDIGSPTSKQDDSVCLAKFVLPAKSGVPSALGISHDLKTVMVGFEEGNMVRFILSQSQLDTFRNEVEQKRLQEADSGDKWAQFGALDTIETKMVYPEGDEWHEGYIDDVYIFGQDGDESSMLYNMIISRGAEDMEFIIWDPNTSTRKDADIMLSLTWPDSQNCSGVRYKVIEKNGQKVLVAGEYDGQIYIYNIGDMKRGRKLKDGSVEQEGPTRILSHPVSSELIRDVCCSNDTRTIVAVDNNNTVFVWNSANN